MVGVGGMGGALIRRPRRGQGVSNINRNCQ